MSRSGKAPVSVVKHDRFDEHTLCLLTASLTSEQIIRALNEAIHRASQALGRNVESPFWVNVVTGRDGKKLGLTFVFLVNSEMYHMLLGRNPDGSKREEILPPKEGDHDFYDLLYPKDDAPLTFNDIGKNWKSLNWADLGEQEDELRRQATQATVKVLPPLVSFTPVPLSVQQREEALAIQRSTVDIARQMGIPPKPQAKVDEHFCYIEASAARIRGVKPGQVPNILEVRNVPTWLKPKQLKDHFSHFVEDTRNEYEHKEFDPRSQKTTVTRDTYPMILPQGPGTYHIKFSPVTTEAEFTLLACKKLVFRSGKNAIGLEFDHAFYAKSGGKQKSRR